MALNSCWPLEESVCTHFPNAHASHHPHWIIPLLESFQPLYSFGERGTNCTPPTKGRWFETRALSFLVLPCLLPLSWFFVCVSRLYWIQCLSGTCMNTVCGLRVYYCMWDEMSSRIAMCRYHNIIEIWRCAFWVGPKGEPARNAQATPQNTLATTQHLKIHTIATAEQCPGNHPEHLGILAETFARTDLTHFSFKHAFILHWTVHWWTD